MRARPTSMFMKSSGDDCTRSVRAPKLGRNKGYCGSDRSSERISVAAHHDAGGRCARRTPDGSRMKALPAAGGQLLVLPILLEHHLPSLGEQLSRDLRLRIHQRAISQLVERVILEGYRRSRRVEPERPLADGTHHGVEAKERPIGAGNGEPLLAHSMAQV